MKKEYLDLLKCIACGHEQLSMTGEKNDERGVVEGRLICNRCGEEFPVNKGIPRFMESWGLLSDTKGKFEFQWQKWGKEDVIFGRTKEESKEYLLRSTGFNLDETYFKGKRVLDAGCGHGRFVELFAEMGAELSVGIDIGNGIEIAKWRNRNNPNTLFIQGSILNLPFRSQRFDFIWSNGVLHHTPNPQLGFSKLCEATKEDGFFNIWLYPKGGAIWEVSQRTIRSFTTRLPPEMLKVFCYLAVPLLYFVPTYSGTNPNKNSWKHCAQVIYDWYSPKYQSHHTNEEVIGWFREEGFSQTDVLDLKVTVVGKK